MKTATHTSKPKTTEQTSSNFNFSETGCEDLCWIPFYGPYQPKTHCPTVPSLVSLKAALDSAMVENASFRKGSFYLSSTEQLKMEDEVRNCITKYSIHKSEGNRTILAADAIKIAIEMATPKALASTKPDGSDLEGLSRFNIQNLARSRVVELQKELGESQDTRKNGGLTTFFTRLLLMNFVSYYGGSDYHEFHQPNIIADHLSKSITPCCFDVAIANRLSTAHKEALAWTFCAWSKPFNKNGDWESLCYLAILRKELEGVNKLYFNIKLILMNNRSLINSLTKNTSRHRYKITNSHIKIANAFSSKLRSGFQAARQGAGLEDGKSREVYNFTVRGSS